MIQWIDISEAASRLGTTARTVRRRCVAGDLPGAEKRDGVWRIPVTADARLGRPAGGVRADADDLAKIPRPKMDEAIRRVGVIAAFEKFAREHRRSGGLRSEAMELFCFRKDPPAATLRRWIARYREEGLAGLVDRRGGARNSETISPEAWEFFKSLYLDPRQPSIRQCWRTTVHYNKKEKLGWTIPSYGALCRYVEKFLPLPVRILYREGEQAYNSKCAPYIQSDLSGIEPGAFWVGDHHQFNVLIRHGGRWVRPWITAWQDMRSRALIGWMICIQPNSTTILQAFKDAAQKHGLPDCVKIDNGRDYDSQLFTGTTKQKRRAGKRLFDEKIVAGLYNLLSIDVSFSKPYHPQSKMIERLFDTIDCQFCKTFSSYCGKSTAQKPEDLNDYLASQQAVDEAETLASFTQRFEDYAQIYNNRPHLALAGQTPMEVFSQRESKRVAVDGVLDLMCRVWSSELTVGKNGIRFNGLYYGQFDPILMNHQGKKVRASCDPDDVSEIFVYDAESWQLIARAECNEIISYGPGVADAQLRAAMRKKTRALRVVKAARTAQRTALTPAAILAKESQQAETRPAPAENLRSKVKLVRTLLDEQVSRHASAGRKCCAIAAGAEGTEQVIELDWDWDEPTTPRAAIQLDWDDDG